MSITERISAIREIEGLSQPDFANMIGMKLQTLRNYEQGKRDSMRSNELEKITTHPRFKKYALWLVTGEVAPEAGQVSPGIEQRRTG